MCGISGIVEKNKELEVDPSEIKQMNELIKHRGPDGEGFYFDKNLALGHRRLSIIDLSEMGSQPMNYQGRYTITYNGEIYNYIEVKEELILEGYIFTTHTDTEVILASYDKWGKDCVNRFNGMWAFAIYDKQKNELFCSRDRLGIKPFYYIMSETKFVFGSEIKQLLNFLDDIYVNKNILLNFIIFNYSNYSEETFFENVMTLLGGCNLIYNLNDNSYKIYRYYNLQDVLSDNRKRKDSAVFDEYEDKLKSAIELRLRSDVKIGTYLSGGLDSSTISSIVAKEYYKRQDDKLVSIHMKSKDKIGDESFHAIEVAKLSDLDLNIWEPDDEIFRSLVDEVHYTQEEPNAGLSAFMQYLASKRAKELGCKVMLDGQGADEILLGYPRYYALYIKDSSLFKKIQAVLQASKNSGKSIKTILQYHIYFTSIFIRKFYVKRRTNYIKKEHFDNFSYDVMERAVSNYKEMRSMQCSEITVMNLPNLVRSADKSSMRHSIENRVPFLDYRLVEYIFSLDLSFKIRNGWTKYILRKIAEKFLPKGITWRKDKIGFEAPQKSWLLSIDDTMLDCIQNSSILKVILIDGYNYDSFSLQTKWKLFSIAKWEQLYNVKIRMD